MRTQQNYGGLDRFRLAAALLVAAIHTSPLAGLNEGADFFLTRILARIAVPFFFMVTGQFTAAGLLCPSVKNFARYHKFLRKTGMLYLFCILLYLPIGIYAGHYQDMGLSSVLRMVIFDGTFYHLWYFPACITGLLLVRLMSRFLSLRGMTVVSAVLYVIGLFGDSYFGLIQKLPALNAVYEFGFRIFSYTRNGLFLAPLFLVLGIWMSPERTASEDGADNMDRKQSGSLPTLCMGLAFSFTLMTVEAFTLRYFELQRHDSMYFALVPTMLFLYRCLLYPQVKSARYFRSAAMWIYILHPAVIVVVRGTARPLGLTTLLVENSLVHYLAVALLSTAAGFLMAEIQSRFRLRDVMSLLSALLRSSPRRVPEEEEYYPDETELQTADIYFSEETESLVPGVPAEAFHREAALQDSDMPDTCFPEEKAPPMPEKPAASSGVLDSDWGNMNFQPKDNDMQFENNQEVLDMQNPTEIQTDSIPARTPENSRAWVELDMAALEQNVEFLRSRLPVHCRLMPAVKAEAYGHGAVPISRQLNRMGVDAFCVAGVMEGVALRQAGIVGEILILGYTAPADFPLLGRYRLTQTVIDYPYARELNQFGSKIHVHIGVDTGMHRVGIRCENIEEIVSVYEMENLAVDGIFTHLCASDSPHPDHRRFTQSQIHAFYQVTDILREQGCSCRGIHILASYGILNLLQRKTPPEGQSAPASDGRAGLDPVRLAGDYVRPGIVLFGVLSSQTDLNVWKNVLRPVLSLKTKVTSVRSLYAGESVGYGITYTAAKDMTIAALSIGYADGLPRELSNGKGSVLINGRRAPIVGRVCMDQCTVDISGIPHVRPGDTAVIIGSSGAQEITAGQLAEQCGTITHEILTGIAGRVDRIIKNNC